MSPDELPHCWHSERRDSMTSGLGGTIVTGGYDRCCWCGRDRFIQPAAETRDPSHGTHVLVLTALLVFDVADEDACPAQMKSLPEPVMPTRTKVRR